MKRKIRNEARRKNGVKLVTGKFQVLVTSKQSARKSPDLGKMNWKWEPTE